MRAIYSKASLIRSGLAATVLLVAATVSHAQTVVNLSAVPTQTVLPDGQTVPMWGYSCAAASAANCAAANPNAGLNWSPIVITVPYTGLTTSLTINLTNSLSFLNGNSVPTSLVIVGQLGGGLGDKTQATFTPSPAHAPQGPTWPASGGPDPGVDCVLNRAGAGALGTNCPPAQPGRVQSFATEALVGAATPTALLWSYLKPGTYLIESGTHPSIQGPMGLYGVLVVTAAPGSTNPGAYFAADGTTATVSYNSELSLVLSEIDPLQNTAVSTAVNTAGFTETRVWSGQPKQCGDPASLVTDTTAGTAAFSTCYPPTVNYDPRYYLINGVSYDQTAAGRSQFATTPALATGTVLVRLVNAGLRMHVPSIVGAHTGGATTPVVGVSLIAEDGNVLPGVPKVQSEVFLSAGKTQDVLINEFVTLTNTSLTVFDRQLSLSTNNRRGGGMLASIARTAGAATVTAASATGENYFCVAGTTLSVTDPAKGVLANDAGANGAVLGAVSLNTATDTLTFNANGTFTYAQAPSNTVCGGTFAYLVNGGNSATAIITQCDASTPGCGALAGTPVAGPIQFISNVATRFAAAPPGVLAGVTSNPGGLPLTAVGTGLNADGSFIADPTSGSGVACPATVLATATCRAISYQAKNAQGALSAVTADSVATVIFLPASNLAVNVRDAKHPEKLINDYRWVIEEDLTVKVDPKCQINGAGRPTTCPPLEDLGYNFHTAHMPIVATGCVGPISCEASQTLLGAPAVCDVGNGACRAAATGKTELNPSQVYIDPAKRYYLSVLPGDGENPTVQAAGGPMQVDAACIPSATVTCAMRQFSIAKDCANYDVDFAPGTGACGHAMGGTEISGAVVAAATVQGAAFNNVSVLLEETPLATSKIAAFVFEDDNPLNGENDAGGAAAAAPPGLAQNEPGLGAFNLEIFDQAGGLGDPTGQITYDMFNQPVSNSLAGTIDPFTGFDACPITVRGNGMIGMIPTCPNLESDNVHESPLRGQAIIANLYPGLYEIAARPGADRIGRGEQWVQTNTLDGTPPHEVFIKSDEPGYFQEFGPGNFHVVIGFANPQIINDRRHNAAGTGMCDPLSNGGGGVTCTANLFGSVSNARMSRTPDQRIFDSGDYSHFSYSQCYVAISAPDDADFAFAKCDPDGNFEIHNIPVALNGPSQFGDFKITIFDQWNDIMLDGLVLPVHVSSTGGDPGTDAQHRIAFPVTQWRTNLYTRTYLDVGDGTAGTAGDGVSEANEPGLPLAATNLRYRDGSFGFFNNTDLNGYAGFNEVFPFVNWLVVETDTTRFKQTGEHVIYDAGGPADGSPSCTALTPCGTAQGMLGLSNTFEHTSLPAALRVPGARYCANADCPPGDSVATGPVSAGRVDPPQPWGATEGWQGLLGQNSLIEFGMKPFGAGENGGIKGHVIYASTRPFDDPTLLLQLSWEPGVPHVKLNLYKEDTAADGSTTLTLADTTETSSFDDWAQGFRHNADGTPMVAQNVPEVTGLDTSGNPVINPAATGFIPNMSCPGQSPTSPFYLSLMGSPEWLDASKQHIAANSQFKCFDGWSMMNQVQPAPYDGMYRFPSITASDPTSGVPTGTNCKICVPNPDTTDLFRVGTPMLPPGKYVVEVVVPPGMELVKEEDKNILLGDIYVAPVTTQFAGFGNIFIMPDQAAVSTYYNKNNTLNMTQNLNAAPRHEGDTGSVESFWPCVGAQRVVPDFNSLYPGAGQNSPFAGALRNLCDRKEVTLEEGAAALAKFYVFTSTHIAGHFTGLMTNDFASEFDPFSPQFGEKFAPPNLPVGARDFTGKEIGRVWADQWGAYDGLNFSTYGVNPPNPTGYVPQMMIMCMNDPGPIAKTDPLTGLYVNATGTPVATADLAAQITDPAYNSAYSNFCYETAFMPGFTAYMDTPVIPTQGFADGYNLPDSEYPEFTPAVASVVNAADATGGPWVNGSGSVASVTVGNGSRGTYTAEAGVTIAAPPSGTTATARAVMELGSIAVVNNATNRFPTGAPTITVAAPAPCPPFAGAPACVTATATANMGGGAVGSTTRRVTSITLNNRGLGYTALPAITVACTGTCTSTGTLVPTPTLRVNSVVVTNGGSGYTTVPNVTFTGGAPNAAGTAAIGAVVPVGTGTAIQLTIAALGDKTVQNPDYSGPLSATDPYNKKAITRHYGFGTQCTALGAGCTAVSGVTIGGVSATINGWSDTQITVTVPSGVPVCSVQQRGAAAAACGQLEITAGNGKKSIDAVTVTIGGKAPTYVVGENGAGNALQLAIDAATPGDLIVVGPGSYKENLLMWKPVRLQGVGAASVTINADAHPVGKMDPWRRQVNCLFGLQLNGVPHDPVGGTSNNAAFDPTGTYTCPASMYLRVDRIPFEAIVGWDATGNGNLAQLLQEPTLMGAYEGAGITVLGRGIYIPATGPGSTDFWGLHGGAVAGAFPDGSRYLTSSNDDCAASTTSTSGRDYGTSNFLCNPSRIDGLSIINSSQGGGAVFIHGWNHNLDVANMRIYANHGTLTGGINLGNGETPPAYINDGTTCGPGVVNPAPLCPPLAGTPSGGTIPFQLNTRVHVHHNMIINNASIGDALFSGTPSGAGGLSISAGADNYVVDHNWIAGNLSTGDGGGMVHSGLSFNGNINHNWILFNQSTNPTLPTNGGGLGIIGANGTRTYQTGPLAGQECGTATDFDCPPGLGDGTGAGLVIDANLLLGNSAESGSGGGLRIQQVNGTEVGAFPTNPARWFDVSVTNNIIANNVAGWDGAGISLEEAFKVTVTNNTVVSNDTTGSAGVLFKALGAINASSPPPGCSPVTDPTQPQNPACLSHTAKHVAQPAGLVTMKNTPNMVEALTGVNVACPSGFGYGGGTGTGGLTNGNCRVLSIPSLRNDMFWHNRAFFVDLVGTMGTGLQSQQNLLALVPQLNQTATGQCVDTGLAASGTPGTAVFYWDIGARDDVVRNDGVGGARLSLNNSILTPFAGTPYGGSNNLYPGASSVIAPYCNGSRLPPENGGHGYQAPPGRSETTGLSTVFVFNQITPAATVDEGNNWINLSYGPLKMLKPVGTTVLANTEALLADAATGTATASYSINGTSSAVDSGANAGAPANDYFGNPRPRTAANPADIGAVEFPAGAAPPVVVTPTALFFANVPVGSTSAAQTLTLTNSGAVSFTGAAVAVTAPFTRSGGTCVATLVAGASCTIFVQYTAPAPGGTVSSGTATITGSSAVFHSPVQLSGTSLTATFLASVAPTPLAFGNLPIGVTSFARTVTVTNTGNSPLAALTFTFGGGTPQVFARSTTSPGSCGTTLAVGASCTYNVVFSPVAITGYSRTLTVAATGATITPASVTLTGTGVAAPSRPTLGVLDNFNRADSSGSLGANWGATALSVNDVTLLTPSTGTAMCVTASLCGLLGGQANWNAAFGANQAAAFTFANSTVGASSLNLKASGTALLGVSPNYIRVMNTGTTVVVQTTTNFGLAFTTRATLSTGSTSASGNVLTALVDPAGVVYVWRTVGATTSYIGGVALPTDPLWTGGGQIGIRMTSGARVDDFAGGTVP